MKRIFLNVIFVFLILLNSKVHSNTNSDKLYEKIDLFG